MRYFLRGIAAVLDLGGILWEPPEIISDIEAIASDWQTVGNDLWHAIKQEIL